MGEHAVFRNRCAVCVEGRCAEKYLQFEPLKEEERGRTKLSFDFVFSTQEKAHTFTILIRRDDGQSQTRARCCERKDPTLDLISFLVMRILQLLKDRNEPSMKVFQELMSHLIVRETKRQQRILRISEEQSINVRITM